MSRLIHAFKQFLDNEGNPLVQGTLRFFEVSTATDKNTYADVLETIPNSNPVLLDARGLCPNVFGTGSHKVEPETIFIIEPDFLSII